MDQQYDKQLTNLRTLIDSITLDDIKNEAQTRFELIDTILTECLGWDRHRDIRVEQRTDVGFADYILSTSRNVMVIEAKKQNIFFELPPTQKPALVSIKNLLSKDDTNLASAMNQAKSYAQDLGISIAVITNGFQYVAFLASRSDGQSPMSGIAAVFTSLEQIVEYFPIFWGYYSRDGVLNENLANVLLKKTDEDPPRRPSSFLDDYPGVYTRNPLQADMMVLSELVLEDLTYGDLEQTFLENCYCETGALSQYTSLARGIVSNRYEQIEDTTSVQIEGVSDKKGIKTDFLEASASRRPVILIGDVGVGKTTFIRNLIAANDSVFEKGDIALHINLGENAILSNDISGGTLIKIKELLLSDYSIDIHEDSFVRAVYSNDLSRLKTSIYKGLNEAKFAEKEMEELEKRINNDAEHVKKSIDHLVRHGRRNHSTKFAIFLDNADQRNSQDQQEVFLVAHELSSQTLASVFVSIRPETFYLSLKEGVLKAYHPKVYTIEPPRIDLVLKKRIEFALKISTGEISAPGLESQTVKLTNLTTMLEVMLRTLNTDNDVVTMLGDIVAGNVRMAVDMVKLFLSSGHTNITKILDIEDKKPRSYEIPLHEFIRSLIYANHKYFNPQSSMIANIYNVRTDDPKEYFLNLILLDRLIKLGGTKVAKHGFLSTAEIYNQLQSLGFLPGQIEKAFTYLLTEGMVENPVNTELGDSVQAINSVRVTTKGSVYVRLLVGTFQYIDSMLVDIPIIDKSLLAEINETFTGGDITIEERLVRSELFVSYLNDIHKQLLAPKQDNYVDNLVVGLIGQYKLDIQKSRISYQRFEARQSRNQ